jgi:hypothetical protein
MVRKNAGSVPFRVSREREQLSSATFKPSANAQSSDMPSLKISVRTIEVQEFYTKCPICEQEITGPSEDRVAYNLELHSFQKSRNDPKHAELYAKLKKGRE